MPWAFPTLRTLRPATLSGPSNLKAVHKGWIHLDRIAPIRVVPAPVVNNQPSGLERALACCSASRAPPCSPCLSRGLCRTIRNARTTHACAHAPQNTRTHTHTRRGTQAHMFIRTRTHHRPTALRPEPRGRSPLAVGSILRVSPRSRLRLATWSACPFPYPRSRALLSHAAVRLPRIIFILFRCRPACLHRSRTCLCSL